MPKTSPPITVVIPTRERVDTLRETLKTALVQDYDGLTILVSDNASQDGTEEFVRSLSDPRLKYVNTGKRLSMAQNYEFALASVVRRDGWVMQIGDDDGLMPGAVRRAAELIAEMKPEAIRSQPCSYAWPSLTGLAWGRLGVRIGDRIEVRNARNSLRSVMRGELSYHELPMLYQGGVVPLALLDAIKARKGTFFRSCIPDVYSAMAIASSIERYVLTDEPLAINGLSGHSIGMSQGRDRFSAGSPARRFQAENDLAFHPDVPLRDDGDYPVGQAIVYEPFLQSAYLREGPSLTDHREQLVLALATAGTSMRLVRPWAQRFAKLHRLDLDGAEKEASWKARAFKLRGLGPIARNATSIFTAGSEQEPITTVAEAARAAGEVRARISGRLRLLPHLTQKAFKKVVQLAKRLGLPTAGQS